MTNAKDIHIIVGIIGNVISALILLSQMPKYIELNKKKSVEEDDEHRVHRNLAMLLKCGLWVLYGLPVVHEDSLLLATANGISFVILAIYVSVFHNNSEDKSHNEKIEGCLVVEFMFLGWFYALNIWAQTLSDKRILTGIVCNVVNINLHFAFAWETTVNVNEKRFKYKESFWLTFLCLIDAGIWTAFSLNYKIDFYVLISKGLETLSCAFQLLVHAYRYILRIEDCVSCGSSTVGI